ncbi:MAG TPA: SusD/RagB family nutrient-binding outer membrane lipoprotein [Ferruginibacter sp.]|nr:SusD/RagB family nutrient-binding outer membrane lipoprotein [Ferruginibacter sp.]
MKLIINKLSLGFLASLLIIASGCQKLKTFGDTNLNPAATTTPITSALLTNVLSQLGNAGVTAGFAANDKAGIFTQYFSEATYPSISQYAIPEVDFDPTYSGPLYDLQNIINISGSPSEVAIARIVKAYIYWRITDRFGDIPYFGALQGTVPAFDKQEAIYKDLVKELKEAVDQFGQGGAIKGDILYGNDPAKWKKLANSLRMLIALQTSKQASVSAWAIAEFNAGLTAGPITDNADNWKVVFPGTTTAFSNPFWFANNQNRDYGVSVMFMNLLSTTGDTRVSALASSTIGVPYGWNETAGNPNNINVWRSANPNWARTMGAAHRTTTSPIFLISSAQTWLARAEAADRGWTGENMINAYNTGIDQSFAQWGLTTPGGYKTQTAVALTAPAGTNANIAKIAIQEFIASFPDGTMGWNIWRRTGFPVLTPSPYPVSLDHTQVPRRYIYGPRQKSLNPGGVAQANASQGPDVQETRVWWDK